MEFEMIDKIAAIHAAIKENPDNENLLKGARYLNARMRAYARTINKLLDGE